MLGVPSRRWLIRSSPCFISLGLFFFGVVDNPLGSREARGLFLIADSPFLFWLARADKTASYLERLFLVL
jgi:hypothetical protein